MKKANKKTTILIIILTIIVFVALIVGIYWHNHPTHYLYKDSWIIGKTAEQIEERYGTYDYDSQTTHDLLIKGYCVKHSMTDWWGDPTWPEYYMIYFDENGEAYKVEVVVGGWGG